MALTLCWRSLEVRAERITREQSQHLSKVTITTHHRTGEHTPLRDPIRPCRIGLWIGRMLDSGPMFTAVRKCIFWIMSTDTSKSHANYHTHLHTTLESRSLLEHGIWSKLNTCIDKTLSFVNPQISSEDILFWRNERPWIYDGKVFFVSVTHTFLYFNFNCYHAWIFCVPRLDMCKVLKVSNR